MIFNPESCLFYDLAALAHGVSSTSIQLITITFSVPIYWTVT